MVFNFIRRVTPFNIQIYIHYRNNNILINLYDQSAVMDSPSRNKAARLRGADARTHTVPWHTSV